jgi:hypothetical protein
MMSGNIAPIVVLDDCCRVFYRLGFNEPIVIAEVHHNQPAGIEKPVIMVRQVGSFGLVASEVTDVHIESIVMKRCIPFAGYEPAERLNLTG